MNGTAEFMIGSTRAEIHRRTALARSILGETVRISNPDAAHFWLPLMRDDAERYHAMFSGAGVVVTAPAKVTVNPDSLASGLRLCIGATPLPDLEDALTKVSGIH
jgi:DNA-binding transcriptional MocR family regulator